MSNHNPCFAFCFSNFGLSRLSNTSLPTQRHSATRTLSSQSSTISSPHHSRSPRRISHSRHVIRPVSPQKPAPHTRLSETTFTRLIEPPCYYKPHSRVRASSPAASFPLIQSRSEQKDSSQLRECDRRSEGEPYRDSERKSYHGLSETFQISSVRQPSHSERKSNYHSGSKQPGGERRQLLAELNFDTQSERKSKGVTEREFVRRMERSPSHVERSPDRRSRTDSEYRSGIQQSRLQRESVPHMSLPGERASSVLSPFKMPTPVSQKKR